MGSGSTTTSSGQSSPNIPGWLKPYIQGGTKEAEAAQLDLPQLSQLFGMVPLLQTAPFTTAQTGLINEIQGLTGNLNPAEQNAQSTLQQFTAPGGGESQATQAEIGNLNTFTDPQVLQQAALMGLGNSGAALSAVAQANQSSLLPILQQGAANQLNASGQLMGLGAQQYNQQTTDLQNALTAAGMPQQLAQEQAQNLFNQLQQQWQYAQGIQQGPLSLLGNVIGGGTSNSITTPPKF